VESLDGGAVRSGRGPVVRLCAPEDLVVHKALGRAPQDVLDIEGIGARQGASLEADYVRRWLEELSLTAEDPEVIRRFERAWAEYGPAQ
jgi:hypothetical protein